MTALDTIKQAEGIGVRRELNPTHHDAFVCLLRVIERLPLLSLPTTSDANRLTKQLEAIHANHQELAAIASEILIDPSQCS